MTTVFYGALVTPASHSAALALPHALLAVDNHTGTIAWVEQDVPASVLQDALARHGVLDAADVDLVELKYGEFLLPGFIDTHTVSVRYIYRTIRFRPTIAAACAAGAQSRQVSIVASTSRVVRLTAHRSVASSTNYLTGSPK